LKEKAMAVRSTPGIASVLGLMTVLVGCAAGQPSPSAHTSPSGTPPSPTPNFTMRAAGPFPADLVAGLRTEVDLPYTEDVTCGTGTCAVPLDVLAPTAASGLPTMVLVMGGPAPFVERRYMEDLAAALASEGAVVYLIGYRSSATGNPNDDTTNDVRCAIRYARATAANYGGDPQQITLVGHSFGSDTVLGMAVTANDEAAGCLAGGDATPQMVVGLAGFHFAIPDDAPPGPRFRLGAASNDSYSAGGATAADQLAAAGFTVEFREFPQTQHPDVVDPATPGLVDYIFWR
jgi:acetyl esterase/lipase